MFIGSETSVTVGTALEISNGQIQINVTLCLGFCVQSKAFYMNLHVCVCSASRYIR